MRNLSSISLINNELLVIYNNAEYLTKINVEKYLTKTKVASSAFL